jgi:hypothetical protein
MKKWLKMDEKVKAIALFFANFRPSYKNKKMPRNG